MTASRFLRSLAAWLVAMLFVSAVNAQTTSIAVAANFTPVAREIAARFREQTGHEVRLSFGSTGKLYAQIAHGAPFDVFLAADDQRPALAIRAGFAIEGTEFTYGRGRLVLYSRNPELLKVGSSALSDLRNRGKVALANPVLAPYGSAAIEVLTSLGYLDISREKTVKGDSITQTFQFVETGNAEMGFVALAQLADKAGGSRWVVPEQLHSPLRQNAVLLKRGEDNPAARAFLDFLNSPPARAVIQRYGYEVH